MSHTITPINNSNNHPSYPYSTDFALCPECGDQHCGQAGQVCVYCELDAIAAPSIARLAARRAELAALHTEYAA